MKKLDFVVAFVLIGFISLFFWPMFRTGYETWYHSSPLIISFLKFGLLATGGEIVSSRICSGAYSLKSFGMIPKMIIWGLLGITIYYAFKIFSGGVTLIVPIFIPMWLKALTISIAMNVIYAPVLMVTHKVTDLHIEEERGRFRLSTFEVGRLLGSLDWKFIWSFLFCKTILFFWIPAHTITFLLPEEFRTVFAALLSVFLGIFLGIKKQMNVKSAS